jgi:hypothetical protein
MSEVHLFLIWSNGRTREDEIREDIRSSFRVLDTIEVEWSPDEFPRNLTCFYGADLPPGSGKEIEAGTGPFIVCVVEDERPRHRYRLAERRLVRENRRVLAARGRYRALTGGGYRVHASAHTREAERDLVLLFGRRPGEFLTAAAQPEGSPRRHTADVLGAKGWHDVDELLLALEVTGGVRQLPPPDGLDLAVEVGDLWWAEHVANGEMVRPGVWKIEVGGRPAMLAITARRAGPRPTAPSA